MIVLPDITLRLAVSSYTYPKLLEVLQRYPPESNLASTTAVVREALDAMLKVGLDAGGNTIVSWDPGIRWFRLWAPTD
jgi:hypothetical protein